jgi:hypothetical protein
MTPKRCAQSNGFKIKGIPGIPRYPLTYDHRMFDDLAPKGFGFDESFHVHV